MAAWVRSIAQSVVEEHLSDFEDPNGDELRDSGSVRLRRELAVHEARTEQRFDRLENALAELAQAQKYTGERVDRLEDVVAELAQAQKRTEDRVEELAQAQKRTEERVEELAQAQKRTEERVAELAQAQRRTEERVDSLDRRVGLIGNVLGLEAEGEAEETLVYILEQKGYQLLETPYALAIDGIEIDIVVSAETPSGERVSVLVDVKARARLKELRRWSNRLQDAVFQAQLVDVGVAKPFLPYFFGLRVYQIVDQEANRLGIGVVDPNGERVEPTLMP
jgi:chromosome segregation ATPase